MPFRSRQRDALADDQAFDLREHRRVRQVEVVAAVDAARRDEPHRRLVRLHVADLHRRGVRAQQRAPVVGRPRVDPAPAIGEVERVLHVARGCSARHVERFEVVVVVFDLRAFEDLEAHAREDGLDALAHDASADGGGRAAARGRAA